MKLMRFRRWFIAAVLLSLFVLGGCGGASPAPPVETPLPITFKFVSGDDLRIDYSAISAATTPSVSKAVGPGGEYSDAIAEGPEWEALHAELLQAFTEDISALDIPVGTTITTFESIVEGETVKIDFADFDYDGDGVKEGCSGSTGALPVCARVWINNKRFLATVFQTFPLVGDPGEGKFRVFADEEFDPTLGISEGFIALTYDYKDPEDLFLEAFDYIFWPEFDLEDGSDPATDVLTLFHLEMRQKGPEDTAIKRLNLRFDISFSLTFSLDLTFRYLGQFKEGQDFWAGSVIDQMFLEGLFDTRYGEFFDVCARISTGDAVEPELANICNDLGISVAGIPFIRPTDRSDVELYDFPETPTF